MDLFVSFSPADAAAKIFIGKVLGNLQRCMGIKSGLPMEISIGKKPLGGLIATQPILSGRSPVGATLLPERLRISGREMPMYAC